MLIVYCSGNFKPASASMEETVLQRLLHIIFSKKIKKNYSNSEAIASELLENLEEIFPLYSSRMSDVQMTAWAS